MRTIKNPPALPRTAVIGPRWKSSALEPVSVLARNAMNLALAGDYDAAAWHRDKAYEAFADAAELELVANTGHDLKVAGLRARSIDMVWAPLLEKKSKTPIDIPEPIQQHCRAADGIRDAAHELAGFAEEAGEHPTAVAMGMRDEVLRIVKTLHAAVDSTTLATAAGSSHDARSSDDDRVLALDRVRCMVLKNALDFLCLLLAYVDRPASDYRKLQESIQDSLSEVLALADKAYKDQGKAIHLAWAGLVKGNGKAATKRAFQATQLPAQWRSEAVTTGTAGEGGVSADPLEILQVERDELEQLWRGRDHSFVMEPVRPWGVGEPLPKLTPAQIRSASKGSKMQTAETYDGFHVRHFELLSDDCLSALCDILEASECLLQMPTCNRTVAVGLVPKPKGGHRPIGIFPALERVGAKARSDLVDQWQRNNSRSYLACAKGSGAADVVWNQSVKAEACVADRGSSASVLMDLKSFFDTVDLDLLLERCHDMSFPTVLARMITHTNRPGQLPSGRLLLAW